MSNEFEVHNFYNHTKEELEEMKSHFDYLWEQAYNFKEGQDDLPNHKTYEDWLKKWDNMCDDSDFYRIAEEYYNKNGVSDD